jgi:hypothetical protein
LSEIYSQCGAHAQFRAFHPTKRIRRIAKCVPSIDHLKEINPQGVAGAIPIPISKSAPPSHHNTRLKKFTGTHHSRHEVSIGNLAHASIPQNPKSPLLPNFGG